MFYGNDYPDWIDEFHTEMCGNRISLDEDVWERIKCSENPPHIGNVIASIMLEEIVDAIVDKMIPEDRRDEAREKFEISINALATSLSFNGEAIYSKEDAETEIKEYLLSWKR